MFLELFFIFLFGGPSFYLKGKSLRRLYWLSQELSTCVHRSFVVGFCHSVLAGAEAGCQNADVSMMVA
jgi:hypothetical protein